MASRQEKYLNLRKKLNRYNYSESFSIESLELVETLFRDVESAAGSYNELQEREKRLAADLSLAQAQLFPLRKENARLVRENNQLHLDNVKKSDEFDERISIYSLAAKNATDEVNELRIKYQAKEDLLAKREKELERLREAYENLLNTSKSSSSKQAISMTNPLSRSDLGMDEGKINHRLSYDIDSYGENYENDSSILSTLRRKLFEAESTIRELEATKHRLTSTLASRDEEYSRLATLAANSNFSNISPSNDNIDGVNIANKRVIDQLNSQIDFLNEQLALREDQVTKSADLSQAFDSLKLQNIHLSDQLKEIRDLNQSLIGQVRAMEKKVLEYEDMTNPDGKFNIDSLISMNDKDEAIKTPSKTPHSPSINRAKSPAAKPSPSSARRATKPDMTVSKLSADNQHKASKLSDAEHENDGLKVGEKLLKERLKRSEEKIKSLQHELDITTQQLQAMVSGNKAKDQEMNRLNENLDDTRQQLAILSERLFDEESKKSSLESKTGHIERSLAEQVKDRQQLVRHIESLQLDLQKCNKEKIDAIVIKDKLEKGWSQMENDVHQYRVMLETMTDESRQVKELNMEAAIRIDQLTNDLSSSKRLTDSHREAYEKLMNSFNETRKDLFEATQRLALIEMNENPNRSTVTETLKQDLKLARDQIQKYSEQNDKLILERDSLRRQVDSMALTHQNLQMLLDSTRQEYSSLEHELNHRQGMIVELTNKCNEWKQENRNVQNELERLKGYHSQTHHTTEDKINSYEQQLSKLKETISRLEADKIVLSQRYDDILPQIEAFKARNEMVISSMNELRDRSVQLEAEKLSLQEQLSLTSREYDKKTNDYYLLKRDYEKLSTKQHLSQNNVYDISEEKESLSQEVSSLKTLIISLEGQVKNSNNKLQNALRSLDDEIEANKELSRGKEELTGKVKEMAIEISKLRDTIREIDEEKDIMQSDLDDKLEQNKIFEQVRGKLDAQIQSLRQMTSALEDRLEQSQQDASTLRRHQATYEGKIHSLMEENNLLKQRLAQRSAEVHNAANDVQLMTQENQALTTELASTVTECENLRRRLSELSSNNSELEQKKRSIEIERDDLLTAYRGVLIDKKRLENDISVFGSMKQKAEQTIQSLQQDLAEWKGRISSYESSENKWLSEKSSYHRQIDLLGDQIHKSERKVEAVEADNRRLTQDVSTLRHTHKMLNDRMQMLMKRVSDLSESGKVMSSRIVTYERERDALQHTLGVEKQKSFDMTRLVENARSQLAAKENELNRLRSISLSPASKTQTNPTPTSSSTRSSGLRSINQDFSSHDKYDSKISPPMSDRKSKQSSLDSSPIGVSPVSDTPSVGRDAAESRSDRNPTPRSMTAMARSDDSSASSHISSEIHMILKDLKSAMAGLATEGLPIDRPPPTNDNDVLSSLGLSGVEDSDDESDLIR